MGRCRRRRWGGRWRAALLLLLACACACACSAAAGSAPPRVPPRHWPQWDLAALRGAQRGVSRLSLQSCGAAAADHLLYCSQRAQWRAFDRSCACRQGHGGWARGLWAVADAALPNYFTRGGGGGVGGAPGAAYQAAQLAVLTDEAAGTARLTATLAGACRAAEAQTAQRRGACLRRLGGECCERTALRACALRGDRVLTHSAACGQGFGACAACYPPSDARRDRPPPVAVLWLAQDPFVHMVGAFRMCAAGRTHGDTCRLFASAARADGSKSEPDYGLGGLTAFAKVWGSYNTRRLMDNALMSRQCDAANGRALEAYVKAKWVNTTKPWIMLPTLLERMFAAVGLADELEVSMELWSEVTGVNFSAAVPPVAHKEHFLDDRGREMVQLARQAKPIKKALEVDVVLYEELKRVFNEQQKARGRPSPPAEHALSGDGAPPQEAGASISDALAAHMRREERGEASFCEVQQPTAADIAVAFRMASRQVDFDDCSSKRCSSGSPQYLASLVFNKARGSDADVVDAASVAAAGSSEAIPLDALVSDELGHRAWLEMDAIMPLVGKGVSKGGAAAKARKASASQEKRRESTWMQLRDALLAAGSDGKTPRKCALACSCGAVSSNDGFGHQFRNALDPLVLAEFLGCEYLLTDTCGEFNVGTTLAPEMRTMISVDTEEGPLYCHATEFANNSEALNLPAAVLARGAATLGQSGLYGRWACHRLSWASFTRMQVGTYRSVHEAGLSQMAHFEAIAWRGLPANVNEGVFKRALVRASDRPEAIVTIGLAGAIYRSGLEDLRPLRAQNAQGLDEPLLKPARAAVRARLRAAYTAAPVHRPACDFSPSALNVAIHVRGGDVANYNPPKLFAERHLPILEAISEALDELEALEAPSGANVSELPLHVRLLTESNGLYHRKEQEMLQAGEWVRLETLPMLEVRLLPAAQQDTLCAAAAPYDARLAPEHVALLKALRPRTANALRGSFRASLNANPAVDLHCAHNADVLVLAESSLSFAFAYLSGGILIVPPADAMDAAAAEAKEWAQESVSALAKRGSEGSDLSDIHSVRRGVDLKYRAVPTSGDQSGSSQSKIVVGPGLGARLNNHRMWMDEWLKADGLAVFMDDPDSASQLRKELRPFLQAPKASQNRVE